MSYCCQNGTLRQHAVTMNCFEPLGCFRQTTVVTLSKKGQGKGVLEIQEMVSIDSLSFNYHLGTRIDKLLLQCTPAWQ